jgi:hypothetical protein
VIEYPSLLLMLGVVALYLQDSAMLLHYDELVLGEKRRGWRFAAGSLRIGGRHLFLPNPLTPARGVFRASWLADADAPVHKAGLEHFLDALSPLRNGVRVLWVLLLVALPLLLWRYAHPLALLALLASMYATIAVLGLHLWQRRQVLEIAPRDIATLVFESAACPPHALNLVRKLCLRRGLRGDTIAWSRRVLGGTEMTTMRAQLDERVDTALAFSDEGSAHHARLQACRRRFLEQSA